MEKSKEMKNTLGDLNAYLFDSLNVLSNSDLQGDRLEEEMKRSKAIGEIAKTVVSNASLVLQAQKLEVEYKGSFKETKMLEG